MPIRTCQLNGKPGYKWGQAGTCYTYKKGNRASEAEALSKAKLQGRAVEARRK
jgi:hypothetical protein